VNEKASCEAQLPLNVLIVTNSTIVGNPEVTAQQDERAADRQSDGSCEQTARTHCSPNFEKSRIFVSKGRTRGRWQAPENIRSVLRSLWEFPKAIPADD